MLRYGAIFFFYFHERNQCLGLSLGLSCFATYEHVELVWIVHLKLCLISVFFFLMEWPGWYCHCALIGRNWIRFVGHNSQHWWAVNDFFAPCHTKPPKQISLINMMFLSLKPEWRQCTTNVSRVSSRQVYLSFSLSVWSQFVLNPYFCWRLFGDYIVEVCEWYLPVWSVCQLNHCTDSLPEAVIWFCCIALFYGVFAVLCVALLFLSLPSAKY